jgi:hypothetical protein
MMTEGVLKARSGSEARENENAMVVPHWTAVDGRREWFGGADED